MDVYLTSDKRTFESDVTWEPGDVAWFEEDVLLVTDVEDGVAQAIEHPAAEQMMQAALSHGQGMPDRATQGLAEAMRIHARVMARGWLLLYQNGIGGAGRVGDDLRVFRVDDAIVFAKDAEDAKAACRESYGWEPEDDAENFEDEPVETASDDTTFGMSLSDPLEATFGQWKQVHGRGIFVTDAY